jgi:tetratricopeptide (TPR) repeat protein
MKRSLLYLLPLLILLIFSIGINAQEINKTTANAIELLSVGKFKDAIADLDKAVEKNKDLFKVYKLRGSIKQIIGDFAGAFSDYSSAIDLKADQGELYEQRAMVRLFTRQDSALILKDLDAAITYGRKVEKVYDLRATIRLQLRDPAGAVSDYETAIGLRPDSARSYVGLAGIYAMNGEDDKAIQVLETFTNQLENSGVKTPVAQGEVIVSKSVAIPANADDKFPMRQGTQIIQSETSTTERPTVEFLNKQTEKLEQAKNTAAAYSNLAAIYERKKNYDKASELVEKALKIDSQEFPAYETRGKIKIHAGDFQGAIKDLNTAIQLMPNIPSMFLERGIAKLLAGNEAEAQTDFDKYLKLFPNGKANLDKRIAEVKEKQ